MMKKDNKKTVLFYSSVKTKKMFSIQSYYRNDIMILRDLGYRVRLSKSCWDFVRFWRYSIAFVYFYRYGFFAALWAKLLGKKAYFTGGIDYLEPSFATPFQRYVQALFFKLCNLLSDRSFIVSSMDCRNVAQLYGEKCHPIVRYVIMWWSSNVFFVWEIHQKRKSNIYWWHGCKI